MATPAPRPQQRPAAAVAPNNGAFAPTEEQTPNWGDLVTSGSSAPSVRGAASSVSPKAAAAQAKLKWLIGDVRKRPKFWGIIAGGALLGFILFIVLLMVVFGGSKSKTDTKPASKTGAFLYPRTAPQEDVPNRLAV